jgi:hypothetical protein
MLLAIRRFNLPVWWLLFPPFIEAWLPGSPDPALLGLALLGGGAVAALTKPYTIPALLADHRWRAVLIAALVGLALAAFLPWGHFFAHPVTATLSGQARGGLSVWGNLPAMTLTAVALVVLRRQGMAMAVPALAPATQLHYGLFSLSAAAESRLLAIGLSVPIAGAAAVSVIVAAAASGPWRKPQVIETP